MVFELNFQAGKTSVVRLNRNMCEYFQTYLQSTALLLKAQML